MIASVAYAFALSGLMAIAYAKRADLKFNRVLSNWQMDESIGYIIAVNRCVLHTSVLADMSAPQRGVFC